MNEKMKKHEGKTPEIIELRKDGHSWKQIAEKTGVPERSLYNLRHSEGFLSVANSIWLDIWADIQKQRSIDQNYNLNESIKNQFKLFVLLSGTNLDNLVGTGAKAMGCDESCPHYTQMIGERRQAISKAMHMLEPTAEQWKKATDHHPIDREAAE